MNNKYVIWLIILVIGMNFYGIFYVGKAMVEVNNLSIMLAEVEEKINEYSSTQNEVELKTNENEAILNEAILNEDVLNEESSILSQINLQDFIKEDRSNLQIQSIHLGSFTKENANEILVEISVIDTAHVYGSDCTIIGLYNADTYEKISEETFNFDKTNIDIIYKYENLPRILCTGLAGGQGYNVYISKLFTFENGSYTEIELPYETAKIGDNIQYLYTYGLSGLCVTKMIRGFDDGYPVESFEGVEILEQIP